MACEQIQSSAGIIVATSNPGKLREFRSLLPSTTAVVGLAELSIESPEEIGKTFLDNALIKAEHATNASGLPALADDSGLEVDALGGMPGVYSARFAGPDSNDVANNRKLIDELRHHAGKARTASFVCAIAFCAPDGFQLTAQARLSGTIVDEGRGRGGFGYDPHFMIDDQLAGHLNGRTLAELDERSKNEISHRRRAFDALLERVGRLGEERQQVKLLLGMKH